MTKQRQAGVLLHISSLPGGDLGEDAFRFVDFLASIGASVWQTLPINMTHADNSPYQCLSAHAGNPAFIASSQLLNDGLIQPLDLVGDKKQVLTRAHANFLQQAPSQLYTQFCLQHQHWLDDFALYLLIREQQHNACWFAWPDVYKMRDTAVLMHLKTQYAEQLDFIKFTQFLFFSQWQRLKSYAQTKQIALFGDIPIFVAYDSADVWARPDLFKLDSAGQMTVVAGVPPDYFSTTGQRWGNPHYNWQAMATENYAWWRNRLSTQSELFDLVRIDHFRGLESAWEIPASELTAMNGVWVQAPGDALLAQITTQLPDIKLVAEDLGIITPAVDALRLKYQLPGMKILQFAFGGDDTNPYLPAQIEANSVVYTGTHDNDTSLGWYHSAEAHVKAHFHHYIQQPSPAMPQALMQLAMQSNADLAIIPMQDILRLDSDCRMNTPGTTLGNWAWQFGWSQLTDEYQADISEMIRASGRSHG